MLEDQKWSAGDEQALASRLCSLQFDPKITRLSVLMTLRLAQELMPATAPRQRDRSWAPSAAVRSSSIGETFEKCRFQWAHIRHVNLSKRFWHPVGWPAIRRKNDMRTRSLIVLVASRFSARSRWPHRRARGNDF